MLTTSLNPFLVNVEPLTPLVSLEPESQPPQKPHCGAQPHNRKAYKHGFYSHFNPPPLAPLLKSISGLGSLQQFTSDSLARAAMRIRLEMRRQLSTPLKSAGLSATLTWHRSIKTFDLGTAASDP